MFPVHQIDLFEVHLDVESGSRQRNCAARRTSGKLIKIDRHFNFCNNKLISAAIAITIIPPCANIIDYNSLFFPLNVKTFERNEKMQIVFEKMYIYIYIHFKYNYRVIITFKNCKI